MRHRQTVHVRYLSEQHAHLYLSRSFQGTQPKILYSHKDSHLSKVQTDTPQLLQSRRCADRPECYSSQPTTRDNKPTARGHATMTSFIQTMFVQSSPPQYPHSPRPLPAIQSNVLVESESYLHLPLPGSPNSIHQSPLHKQVQGFFSTDNTCNSSLGSPRPSPVRRQELRQPEAHRGLGYGFAQIATQADLFARSNSNARNRQTFQSQKRAKGTTTWQLKQFADATLGGNSLRKCVQLPEGEDRSEWLAVNSMLHACGD